MSEWPLVPLSEVADWGSGGTPSRSNPEFYGGDIPWATIADLTDGPVLSTGESITRPGLASSSAKLVPEGSVLVAMYGSIGKLGIPQVPMATNQAIAFATPRQGVLDRRFLFHFLRAQRRPLLAAGRGGTQANISQTILKSWKIPLPPLSEQCSIASILDHADTLRAKRREAIARLDELTQSIFIDMFGDPAADTATIEWTTIGDMLQSAHYGTSEKSGSEGEFPVLRMGNITYDGRIDLSDLKYMDLPADKIARFTARSGDILFNRTNSAELVGKTAVFRGDRPISYAGYLVRLRVKDGNSPEYISAFLNSRYGKAVLRGMCKSIVGMANINAKEAQAIRIPKADPAMQQQFSDRCLSVEDARLQHISALSSLDSLFSSLQSRAFKGEL